MVWLIQMPPRSCNWIAYWRGRKMIKIVPECPAEAIKPDTEPGLEEWEKLNHEYAAKWPNITVRDIPPADAKEWDGVPGKLSHFSPAPHEAAPAKTAERASEVTKGTTTLRPR